MSKRSIINDDSWMAVFFFFRDSADLHFLGFLSLTLIVAEIVTINIAASGMSLLQPPLLCLHGV